MLALCIGVNLIPAECHWSIAKIQQQYNHLSLKDILTLKVCALQCTCTFIYIYIYTHIYKMNALLIKMLCKLNAENIIYYNKKKASLSPE